MHFEVEDERAFTFASLINNEKTVREIMSRENLTEIIKVCEQTIKYLTNY